MIVRAATLADIPASTNECCFVTSGVPTEHIRAGGERFMAIPMTRDMRL